LKPFVRAPPLSAAPIQRVQIWMRWQSAQI
jgi:hypothetical protein